MLRRFASALLMMLLLGALFEVAARGNEACRMRGMHDCCKKALANSHAPEAISVPPCCSINSPRPAPPNTNFNFRFAPDSTPSPRPPATQAQNVPTHATTRGYAQPFQPSHSPPAYIQHLALLI